IGGVESAWSRRIRLAEVGGPGALGGGEDVRMSVTVEQTPRLPRGVELSDVVPYSSSNDGQKITVRPADSKLMAAWKGNGQVQPKLGDDIRSGISNVSGGYIDAVPPTFLLELQNRSRQAIQISALRLEVASSETDNQPAIQMVDLTDD